MYYIPNLMCIWVNIKTYHFVPLIGLLIGQNQTDLISICIKVHIWISDKISLFSFCLARSFLSTITYFMLLMNLWIWFLKIWLVFLQDHARGNLALLYHCSNIDLSYLLFLFISWKFCHWISVANCLFSVSIISIFR